MRALTIGSIGVVLLAGLANPAAAASPLIPEFEQFCLARDLTAKEVETQARAQGYVAPPAEAVKNAPEPFNRGGLLWKATEGGAVFLLVAENVPKTTPYPSRLCTMARMPGSASDVADFEQLIGFKPVKTGFRDVYLFKEIEGRRIPTPATEATLPARLKGDHVTAGGFYEGGPTIYMVARPLKATPPAQ